MSASSCTEYGTHMDADLYKAATKGDIAQFKGYEQHLDCLLTENKSTILHIYLNSPFSRSVPFVEYVLGHCAELLWMINEDDNIPLHIAAMYGHSEIIQFLIERAKLASRKDLESGEGEAARRMLRITNKYVETALHLAARSNHLEAVKKILADEDLNFDYTANKSGETPLYLAASKGYNDIAIEILNKFESPDCSGPDGKTIFHAAVPRSVLVETDLIDFLLKKKSSLANIADESGWTPLHYAAYLYRPTIVTQILAKDKSSAYIRDKDRKRTALHLAACRGFVNIMNNIISECPECCEFTDARGWNVLHYAVISKCDDAVKAILENSSLMFLIIGQDDKGYTPFHLILQLLPKVQHWIYNQKKAEGYNLWRSAAKSASIDRAFLHDRAAEEERILEWTKDLGSGPFGQIETRKKWQEVQNEREEKVIPELKEAKDSHLVAAALVATVTFAAAFTLPGGYIGDENESKQGTPILSRNAAFKAFVITDAVAMVLSTSSVFIHFILVILGYKNRYYWLIRSAFWFVVLAMGAMVVAFVTGTYAVLGHSKGLAIATCVIGLSFFVHVVYTIIRLIFEFIKFDKVENRGTTTCTSLRRLLCSAPQYLSCGSNLWRLKSMCRRCWRRLIGCKNG